LGVKRLKLVNHVFEDEQIKDRYITGDPDSALALKKSNIKDADPVELLSSASKLLQCDLESVENSTW
jgi:hypothetical protein